MKIRPSQDDINITKKLKEGAKLLDVTVLNQMIITSGSYYSFADEGIL
jgi:DNA repair protein RadC